MDTHSNQKHQSIGYELDPETCNGLSLEEKRKLIHEIVENSNDAPEILRCFTRRELLRVICFEMGKERKYTGYSKSQMIDQLLKLISGPNKRGEANISTVSFPAKKQRIAEAPPQVVDEVIDMATDKEDEEEEKEEEDEKISPKFRVCENVACRANLSLEDPFCRRCSCCICHRYDDNKDPSLWLICDSDIADEDGSCGMSCHLECALKHERSGILKRDGRVKLDGSFYCISCGIVNDIMRTWKKQLVVAKEVRRVDALCLRLSLCYKILLGTEQYKEVQAMVESAVKMLNKEVGPLDHVCSKMSRGIVNRLSCGTEVQKICSSALEYFDSTFSYTERNSNGIKEPTTCKIQFEELSSTSVTIVLNYEDRLLNGELGCRLWHRKCDSEDYPEQPSFIVLKPEKRFKITKLEPSTGYFCKVSLISSRGELGVWEAKWITLAPPSKTFNTTLTKFVKQENVAKIIGHNHSQAESTSSSDIKLASKDNPVKMRMSDGVVKRKMSKGSLPLPSTSVLPLTPCKSDRERKAPSPGCEKRSEESDYEYSVRVVKWLEDEGLIDTDFRVKFLTWFSLKATKQERRVVSVFVDTFVEDPPSLAGQLVHTFLDKICVEQKPVSQHKFCKDCGVESRHVLSFLCRK